MTSKAARHDDDTHQQPAQVPPGGCGDGDESKSFMLLPHQQHRTRRARRAQSIPWRPTRARSPSQARRASLPLPAPPHHLPRRRTAPGWLPASSVPPSLSEHPTHVQVVRHDAPSVATPQSSSKKDALVRQLRGLTNATQADATRLLKANGYRIEAAVDAFYGDEAAMANATAAPGGAGAEERKRDKESRERLSKLFDQYKDDDGDDITIEGAMRMCTDLGISPEDVVMLPLSYYLRSDSIGHFARQHYVDGWRTVDASADTLEAQRRALPRLRAELEEDRPVRGERAREGKPSHGLYRRVYEYTYSLARAEGQKSLALDSATAFWDLVLPSSPTFARPGSQGRFTQAQLELWKRYLAEKTAGRAVSRDTWMMFYDFTAEIDERFEEHDFDGAWPSVIDDFVVWAKGQVA